MKQKLDKYFFINGCLFGTEYEWGVEKGQNISKR